MKLQMKQKTFAIAVAYWLVIIVIAHFFAPPRLCVDTKHYK